MKASTAHASLYLPVTAFFKACFSACVHVSFTADHQLPISHFMDARLQHLFVALS